MVAISKIIGVLSCGFMLCLGLSNVASSADQLNTGQSDKKMFTVSDKDRFEAGKELKGEVVRVEGANYFVKGQDGKKEVRLHTDSTTQTMTGIIGKWDRTEAKVNDQSHALSINKTSTH
jgi:hypothetical protein